VPSIASKRIAAEAPKRYRINIGGKTEQFVIFMPFVALFTTSPVGYSYEIEGF
jgi:hypothetical protein